MIGRPTDWPDSMVLVVTLIHFSAWDGIAMCGCCGVARLVACDLRSVARSSTITRSPISSSTHSEGSTVSWQAPCSCTRPSCHCCAKPTLPQERLLASEGSMTSKAWTARGMILMPVKLKCSSSFLLAASRSAL